MSVQSARAAGAVGDAAGLLVDGSEAGRRRRRALRVGLHARQQDAAQRGLSGGMEDQRRGEACKSISAAEVKESELLEVVRAARRDLLVPPVCSFLF